MKGNINKREREGNYETELSSKRRTEGERKTTQRVTREEILVE